MTTAVDPPLAAESSASVPCIRSASESVVQPLAIWGHANPWTPPRLQNLIWAARPWKSISPAEFTGVKPIGKMPASFFLAGNARRKVGIANTAAPTETAPRNCLRFKAEFAIMIPPARSAQQLRTHWILIRVFSIYNVIVYIVGQVQVSFFWRRSWQ